MKLRDKFIAWVDGERPVQLCSACKGQEEEKPGARTPRSGGKAGLGGFKVLYPVLCTVISVLLLAALILTALAMPQFGDPGNPTNNEVSQRYVGSAEEETGAGNVIAGMILNYRGFDTFGESCVLFLSVCCVMLLLMPGEGEKGRARRAGQSGEDLILSRVCRLIIPCVLCFGVCILSNGHVSPGGGFSGGSTLGAALILFAVAYGDESVRAFFTRRVYDTVRISGLIIYALMFGVYIFQGANGIASPLAHYIVLVIDIAVGLVVMSTMYGFYSFYTRGEL